MAVRLVEQFSSLPQTLADLGCVCWVLREASCPWETEDCRPVPRSWTLACGHQADPAEPHDPEERERSRESKLMGSIERETNREEVLVLPVALLFSIIFTINREWNCTYKVLLYSEHLNHFVLQTSFTHSHTFIQRLILWLSNYKNYYFARVCGLKEQGVKLNHNRPFVTMFMSNMPKFPIMISV